MMEEVMPAPIVKSSVLLSDEDLALQTRFYVSVRRASGRVIDLVWFRQNKEYARAVLDYAESMSDHEVRDAARRLRFSQKLI